MRRNTIDEQIECLQALKEGKKLEWYSLATGLWYDSTCDIDMPNFRSVAYRVKREPREYVVYVSKHNGGICTHVVGGDQETLDKYYERVVLREVMED